MFVWLGHENHHQINLVVVESLLLLGVRLIIPRTINVSVGWGIIWQGIRGTQVKSSVWMKKMHESSKWLFLGNLIPEIESKARISLVASHLNESALKPIGGLFLLEPLHPRYLGWMILLECHESPAVLFEALMYIVCIRERCCFSLVCTFKKNHLRIPN
jgi:hypothetical protein